MHRRVFLSPGFPVTSNQSNLQSIGFFDQFYHDFLHHFTTTKSLISLLFWRLLNDIDSVKT